MKKSNKSIVVIGVFLVAIILSIKLINNKREEVYELDSSNLKEVESKGIAILYKDSEEGEYIETDSIPKGNYEVDNEQSYCLKNGSESHIQTKMEYKENKVYIKADNSGLKCFVYLKKIKEPTAEDTLAKLPNLELSGSGCPAVDSKTGNASITSTEASSGLLCEGQDDYGTTYYFRGVVDNNWVKIGNYYWRIIRINGDGTIRLIYNGNSTDTVDKGIAKASVAYNKSYNDNAYVGFMYGTTGQKKDSSTTTAYEKTHANITLSNILTELNTWYNGNEIEAQYKNLLDGNAGFCNDRSPYPYSGISTSSTPDKTKYGIGSELTSYGAYFRTITSRTPSFKCPNAKDDLFTTQGSTNGNQKLTNPVGLITADEVVYAGGLDSNNTNYWLYNHQYYWTMSPYYYYYIGNSDRYAVVFSVDNCGRLYANRVDSANIGVRPVINLKADTKFTTGGEGTSGDAGSSTNPYVVQLS